MYHPDLGRWKHERAYILSESIHTAYANAVDGDVAEFGIARGISFDVIASTMAACDPISPKLGLPTKHLHGFDSFQGLPEATLPEDTNMPMVKAGIWGKGKCSSAGLDFTRVLAERHIALDRIHLYPGWFTDTFPLLPKSVRFSVVHIDCDLYESSRQVLNELFGNRRLHDGCILLLDDFSANRGSKKLGQRKAWEECRAKYAPDITDLGFYSLGSWRCMVHVDA